MTQLPPDYAAAISRTTDAMCILCPEKSRAEIEALASMCMDSIMQHGFTEQGYQSFERLVRLEG